MQNFPTPEPTSSTRAKGVGAKKAAARLATSTGVQKCGAIRRMGSGRMTSKASSRASEPAWKSTAERLRWLTGRVGRSKSKSLHCGHSHSWFLMIVDRGVLGEPRDYIAAGRPGPDPEPQ